jgi:uncharacterized membrane protein YagU involved in acid resistance
MTQVLSSKATLDQVGWRYYNQIRKKAIEQEFSWVGLLVNLSIAFFIVISSAFCLSVFQKSVEVSLMESSSVLVPNKIYHLEENFRSELSDLSSFNNLS